MAAKQPSYVEAQTRTREAFAKAQLADPESHFPYKRDQALAALQADLDPASNNHPEHWYTSEQIIEAAARYTDAQQALLEVQASGESAEDLEAARLREREAANELVAARQQHRRGRPIAPVAVAGAPAEIEQTRSAMRALADKGFNAAQIADMFGRGLAEVQGALAGRED